ncbi:DUF2949 domain-containing protein [Synechococcus sp. PCC 6312]|uniref:DUF2949 domain-containing protein n=1 Tax=Synechococcus sp. (strain ATCC 27167 / PCC 6312) TaxID=195253 RepID=UPI00029F4D1A|nr:DUF2949 domain-containing protein [Synechococcus sp. PCC 6312]AFY60742.1 Protein of unknown function (DUF2949) [Synechococcus sp. PCC 6312]
MATLNNSIGVLAMQSPRWKQLIEYLQGEMALPSSSIALGLKHCDEKINLLPVVLWKYGLVSIEQLDQIFDWMETS